jgi:hypothetical protein
LDAENDPIMTVREFANLDILSKKSGPRDEDRPAKEHLARNWGTIEKLADTLSGGKYSADKAKKLAPKPQAQGLIIVDQARARVADIPVPFVRISMNGRVVIADEMSGLQLHFLGQLKRQNGSVQFVIATAQNGFISPVDPDIYEKIADLADRTVNRDYPEEVLVQDIERRLEIV